LSLSAHRTSTFQSRDHVGAADADDRSDAVPSYSYVGLAMAIGVLLLAVGSYLGGKDHGIGSVVTAAIKSAVEHATGTAK